MHAALDIGGTKIAGALVDADGHLRARAERPTGANGTAEEVMSSVTQVLDSLAADPRWARVRGLGIASAGPVDAAAGTISPVNIPAWRGFPLVDRVRAHPRAPAGPRPVLIGDAVAMAAAEHWRGAARGTERAMGIVVSTGVGGGLILDGRIHPGPTGNAGHIGHISVDLNGEQCPCGGFGCVEMLASGPAIARHARQLGWTATPGGTPGATPERPADAAAVARAARDGDARALAAFDRAGQALAAGIAATASLVELDLVVVGGGGVARAGDLLFAPVRAQLRRYATLSFTRAVRVEPSLLAQDAGLIGAAAAVRARSTAPASPAPV